MAPALFFCTFLADFMVSPFPKYVTTNPDSLVVLKTILKSFCDATSNFVRICIDVEKMFGGVWTVLGVNQNSIKMILDSGSWPSWANFCAVCDAQMHNHLCAKS